MAAIVDVVTVVEKNHEKNQDSETSNAPLPACVDAWRDRINSRLADLAHSDEQVCQKLDEAVRSSLLAPGKRVRPLLAVLSAIDLGHDPEPILDFGCALELVHCASLMLDDLPCMDDARTRRGQPAAHIQFGEATTTLAAVALLSQSFSVLAEGRLLPDGIRCRLVSGLSKAVGTTGLVSGQSRDLVERQNGVDSAGMARINQQKTGVLFEFAVVGAGIIVDLPGERLDILNRFAGHVGQAFQCADDLLDCRQHGESSGKDCCADVDKAGSVHQVGETALRHRLNCELAAADEQLDRLGLNESLMQAFVRSLFRRLI